jgi:hypothetical protein
MRTARLLLLVAFVATTASPLFAQDEWGWSSCNSAEYSTSQCIMAQNPEGATPTAGGHYTQCTAYRTWGEMCQQVAV